jgi:hypothetical protein
MVLLSACGAMIARSTSPLSPLGMYYCACSLTTDFSLRPPTPSVEIPLRVPTAAILDPRDGSRMEAGSPLRLWGIGTHGTGKLVEPGYARWLINGNEVARGLNVFVTAPSEGKHSCTLIIEAGRESTEVTITFETVAVPHESTEL